MTAEKQKKIFSIILASNKPENLTGLFDNLEQTCESPDSFEVLVKVDKEDLPSVEHIKEEKKKRPFEIRYIATPRDEGYYTLHHAYQQLFTDVSDPDTYFLSVFTDEIRFQTKGWDQKLRNYIKFFPDDVFRLRISENKFRNYYALSECISSPENYSIATRQWYTLTEGMGDVFWGVDSWHQCIEYYLGQTQTKKNFQGINRGIPIYDIEVGGMEAGEGWSGEAQEERIRRIEEGWLACNAYEAHQKMYRLATRLAVHIWAHEEDWPDYDAREDDEFKVWFVYESDSLDHPAPIVGCQYYLPYAAYLHEKLPRLLNIYRSDPFGLTQGRHAWPPLKEFEHLESTFNQKDSSLELKKVSEQQEIDKITPFLTAANLNNIIRQFCALSINYRPRKKKGGSRNPAFKEFSDSNMESIETTIFDTLDAFNIDEQKSIQFFRHMLAVRSYLREMDNPNKKYMVQAAIMWLSQLIGKNKQ